MHKPEGHTCICLQIALATELCHYANAISRSLPDLALLVTDVLQHRLQEILLVLLRHLQSDGSAAQLNTAHKWMI